jgi:hypothetical protein
MTTEHTVAEQRVTRVPGSRLRVPRSRGALSGALLALLGVWGAIVPFVGPYFDFAFTPDNAWTWTAARGWLDVLPGCVALVAGLVILTSANRVVAGTAAWFGVAAGGWFVVGPQLADFAGIGSVGVPTQTGSGMIALEWLAYFYALGAVIVFFSAAALGRLSVHGVADLRAAERREAERVEAERVETQRTVPAPPTATVPPTSTVPATAPVAAAPVAEPAPATEPDVIDPAEGERARASAREAIARERDGHAHRRFLHGRREQVSATDDRTPR